MARILVILLIALLFEAIGVVFLSRGLKEMGDLNEVSVSAVKHMIVLGVTNRHILLGVFFEALFFIGLLMLMSKADVSFVWPMTSLSFVVTTIAAKIYLHEHVAPLRWSGVCLIMMGAALITWTEKTKEAGDKIPAIESAAHRGVLPQ